jgi:molecular chaperone GrpE
MTEQSSQNTQDEADPLAPSEPETEDPSANNQATSSAEEQPSSDSHEVASLQEQLAAAKDQTLRALAELENTRRRAQKDREEAGSYAISKFARDLLEVSDNLRRALESVPEDFKAQHDDIEPLITGVEATEREMLKVFERHGIEKIEPLDEKFDPNYHEVMFEAPMPGKPNGTIMQLIEPGYVLKGRLLRPARVGVAKNPEEPPKDGDGHFVNQEA